MGLFFKSKKEKIKALKQEIEIEKLKTSIAEQRGQQAKLNPTSKGGFGSIVSAVKKSGIKFNPNPGAVFGVNTNVSNPPMMKARKKKMRKVVYVEG